jgi:cell division protease FtsH
MLEHAAPLIKVTIVPRGQSLGQHLPEERLIVRADQMLTKCAPLWEEERLSKLLW